MTNKINPQQRVPLAINKPRTVQTVSKDMCHLRAIRRRRVAVVASLTHSLTNFRLQLLKRMVEEGYDVVTFAPDSDERVIETLSRNGIKFVRIPMSRTATNPVEDLRTLTVLWKHFRRMKPDIVIPYTMKPIIYGSLAARLAGVGERYALVTGLGHVFSEGKYSLKKRVLRWVSVLLYRAALRGIKRVFVYNEADWSDLLCNKIVRDRASLIMVPGSGVDLQHFAFSTPPAGPPTFLLVARLLRDKGIGEYVEAAGRLRARHPGARVRLIGPFDPNPSAISEAEVDRWVGEGVIEYLGTTRDIRPIIAEASVVVLPSYYREGIPRSLLEALAIGRAIITADMPGCRETVIPGENGYLVPPRDAAKLAEAMEAFVVNPTLAYRMGRRSRELAVQRFDVDAVNRLILSEMHLI